MVEGGSPQFKAQWCKASSVPPHVPPLQNRQDVEKVYLARVVGTFPRGRIKVHAALAWDARTNHTFVTSITALGAIQDAAAQPAAPADGHQWEARAEGDWAAQPAAVMPPAGQSAEGSAPQGAPAAAQGQGMPASSVAGGRVSEARPAGSNTLNPLASGMAMPPAGGPPQAAPNLEELQKYGLHSGGEELSAEDLERRKNIQGKDAVTEFRLLRAASDGLTSVVQCRPLTGRTHQLRCAQGSLTESCAMQMERAWHCVHGATGSAKHLPQLLAHCRLPSDLCIGMDAACCMTM